MKAKKVPCPTCQARMRRKYGYYKAFWKCRNYGYRTMYECPNCKERMALVTMDETGYNAYIQELHDYFMHEAEQASQLRILLNNYRESAMTTRMKTELDALEKSLGRFKTRLRRM